MGRRGFPPTPTKIKLLRGNPGRRPLNDAEPQPREGVPKRPAWLTKEGAKAWDQVVAELEPTGVLTTADGLFLAWLSTFHALGVAAVDALLTNGLVFETSNRYPQRRPEMGILIESVQMVRALGAELGLSPASRTRIRVEKPQEEDAFDAFLKRKHVSS